MPSESDRPDGYDPDHIARFYDELGGREWVPFDRSPASRVSLEIHMRLLREFIRPGDRVLDAGAGPGRFTIELARLGTTILVGDISPEQLRLNEEKVEEAGRGQAVEARELLDITDLSRFGDATFDAVVCLGGPLSYVREQAPQAVRELVRVLKPGGHLLVSVMSALGTHRVWLDDILGRVTDEFGLDAVSRVFETDDITPEVAHNGHTLTMYRYVELKELLEGAGCEIVAASAANFLTARADQTISLDEERWERLLEWEVDACRAPGAVDGGTHIVVAAQRPAS